MSKGFHYPYHLLVIHSLTIILFLAIQRLAKTFTSHQQTAQERPEQCSIHTGISGALVYAAPCLYMACVVGTALCVYQAVYHFVALPVLAMLLVLDWSSIFAKTDRRLGRGLMLAFTALCGMAMIFAFDRKLTKGGIIGSIVAIVLTGLARSMDAWTKNRGEREKACCCVYWQSAFVIPLFVVLIGPALMRRYEYPIYTPAGSESLGMILAFNLISVLAAWRLNWSYFSHVDPSATEIDSEYITWKELRHLIAPVAVVGLVTAGSLFTQSLFTVSSWQHVGFLIAMSAIYIASHTPEQTALEDTEKNYTLLVETSSAETTKDGAAKALSKRIVCALTITLVVGILCFTAPMFWRRLRVDDAGLSTLAITESSLPRKDASLSLDFVVSRYDESASSLADNLRPLLKLQTIDRRATRVVVYNTGEEDHRNSTFQHDLQKALGLQSEITVENRENVGREGAAYLHHITSKWNSLADHTLFMQAELHNPKHVRQLLHNYLMPQTGFLSLSCLQNTCSSCKNCWDHSTWSETTAILADLYSRANQGAKCQPFVLTYRGQFVVSRKRIQSPGRGLFADILDGMTNPNSDKHSEEYVQQPWLPQKIDSLNRPRFGYTLERIWGVLMGCSDPRLAVSCPSRLSASLRIVPGSEGDCQCLDGAL